MLERLIQEVRHREKVIRIFPQRYLKTDGFYKWLERRSEKEAQAHVQKLKEGAGWGRRT
jgi:methyl coenzyme M reductase subunit D